MSEREKIGTMTGGRYAIHSALLPNLGNFFFRSSHVPLSILQAAVRGILVVPANKTSKMTLSAAPGCIFLFLYI